MDTQQLRQFEQDLVDEFFSSLAKQTHAPLQIAAPQAAEPPRPYYRGPSQKMVDRQQIEAQLRALVEASTMRLYTMLTQRLDEMKAQHDRIETQQKQNAEQRERLMLEISRAERVGPPCTPSRNNLY